eukprot:152933_1
MNSMYRTLIYNLTPIIICVCLILTMIASTWTNGLLDITTFIHVPLITHYGVHPMDSRVINNTLWTPSTGFVTDLLSSRAINNTVWIVAANSGIMDTVHNFICNMKMLQNDHWFYAALDNEAYEHALNQKWPTLPIKDMYYDELVKKRIIKQRVNVATKHWFDLTHLKILPVLKVLDLGFNVIFSDPDIYYNKDPTKYILNLHHKYHYDFVVSVDGPEMAKTDLNSGFWFATPEKKQILEWTYSGIPRHVFDKKIKRGGDQKYLRQFGCKQHHKNKNITDYRFVNDEYHEMESLKCFVTINEMTISWLYLNSDLFASGNGHLHSDREYIDVRNSKITLKLMTKGNKNIQRYLVHSNWVLNASLKIERMKQSNLWLLDGDDKKCIYKF